MKTAGVFFLICIAALSTTAKQMGECETIENKTWGAPFGTLKICVMQLIAIDSKNFSITSDRDVSFEGFSAGFNKKLEHLPNNLGMKFPSLLALRAYTCSIKEVSKDNFKELNKLRWLDLASNQIEKIDDDTFEYIPAVERIDLRNNKIKKLNGHAFASLHKLTQVQLRDNKCINEDFFTATKIAELPEIVTGKCGFTEPETSGGDGLMAQSEPSAAKNSGGGGTWLICLGFLRLAKKNFL